MKFWKYSISSSFGRQLNKNVDERGRNIMWERILPSSLVYYKNPLTQNLAFHAVRLSSVWTYSLRHFNLGDIRTRLLLRKNIFFSLIYLIVLCIVMYVCAILSLLKICRDHPCIWSGTIFRAHFSLDNGLELVWTMVWNLSDQGSLQSETRLIRGGFERTSSAHSSDQSSLRSGTVWSEAISSATSTWVTFWYRLGGRTSFMSIFIAFTFKSNTSTRSDAV